MKMNLHIAVFFLFASGLACFGQTTYGFRTLSPEDGLSQVQVNAIHQDRNGFIWVGTKDGLNRYDGYEFKVFTPDPQDPNALSDNYINSLAEDGMGRVWIGTHGGGINRFDEDTEQFTAYRHDPLDSGSLSHNIVYATHTTPEGHLWVGTQQGLNRFNPETNRFFRHVYEPKSETGLYHPTVSALWTQGATLWVGTWQGINRLDTRNGSLSRFKPAPGTPDYLAGAKVLSFFSDDEHLLWVGTERGLFRVNPGTGQGERFLFGSSDPAVSIREIHAIIKLNGLYWVGTTAGVFAFDPTRAADQGSFADRINPNDVPFRVSALLVDRSEVLWISNVGRGISVFNTRKPFQNLTQIPGNPAGLSAQHVYSVFQDRQGVTWIGTPRGLDVWDPEAGEMHHFKSDRTRPNHLTGDWVWSIYQDADGDLWFGTYGGLNHLSGKNWREGKFTYYDPEPHLPNKSVRVVNSIAPAGDDRFLLGTANGVSLLDTRTGEVRLFRHDLADRQSLAHDEVRIIQAARGPAGRFWVGTEGGGLDLFNLEEGRFRHYPPNQGGLSNGRVLCFLDRGQLWIGTRGGGINILEKETGRFTWIREGQGLPNDTVYALLEDESGAIWSSTNKGLVRIDPDTMDMAVYGTVHGLPADEFNTGAYFKSALGRLFFGSTQGITSFFPHEIKVNGQKPLLALTAFRLFDEPVFVDPGGVGSPLARPINQTQKMALDADQNVFSFEFACLDFASPQSNRYAYQMEGFDKEWRYTDAANRIAHYTNLDPRDYVFRVKAGNGEGVWSDPRGIELAIAPPIWRTWWAWCCYIAVLAGLVFGYMRYQERQRLLLELKVEARTRALKKKNAELDANYRELDTLDHIVKAINREVAFDRVALALLEQGRTMFDGVTHGYFLLFNPRVGVFNFAAAIGYDFDYLKNQKLTRDDLMSRLALTDGVMERLEQGVHVVHHFRKKVPPLLRMEQAASLLGISLPHQDDPLAGLLVLANMDDELGFRNDELGKMMRFREHAVSALNKARNMEELMEAQKQLIEGAHAAGMAENATNVLHNLGNSLNSVQTSSQLIGQRLRHNNWTRLLARGFQKLKEADPTEAASILAAMEQILEKMGNRDTSLKEETDRLNERVMQMVTALRQQHQHVYASGLLAEPADLNKMLGKILEKEERREPRVEIVSDFSVLPLVRVEAFKFGKIVRSLIQNAREAIAEKPHNGELMDAPLGQIKVTTRVQKGTVEVRIVDNGPGINVTCVAQIFAPGFTTKIARDGQGLHYCANAMREMAGEIHCRALDSGEGTEFLLSFPASVKQPVV